MNILIIDDDAEDTEIFCHVLQELAPEINCTVVNNPRTAISYLSNNKEAPEYIFLDANMFLLNGKDCLKELRKISSLQPTKIIMYSGYISEKQVEELINLGANQYLHKPNSYDELKSRLSALLIAK
jgi:DNA-binding response OmpR family regulator